MILREFLKEAGTEKNLAELILFLSAQAGEVRKGFLATCTNTAACGTKNMFGEDQKPLDKYADDVFVEALKKSRLVRYIATEEQDAIIEVKDAKNNFGVVIDPLDGSSLLDVNLCVGSIIGIYPGNVLDKGTRMAASLYMLYGPLTLLRSPQNMASTSLCRTRKGSSSSGNGTSGSPTGRSIRRAHSGRTISLPMPPVLHISKRRGTSSGSRAALWQMSTRSSTRAVSSPTRPIRGRRRENCASCTRPTRWA